MIKCGRKPRSPNKKNQAQVFALLAERRRLDKEQINELWLEFREAKQYAAIGDLLDEIASFKCQQEEVSDNEYKEAWPRNGSTFWVYVCEVPSCFYERELR